MLRSGFGVPSEYMQCELSRIAWSRDGSARKSPVYSTFPLAPWNKNLEWVISKEDEPSVLTTAP